MRISTLGFRGEALPSIAAVSDVHLKTSNGEQTGYFINIKGGTVITEEPFAIRKGTEIEVNHLFFNTPARLKHIKSLNTELSHITEYMTKTALAHPDIAITLTNNNREVFKTPGNTDVQTVIARIYGFDIAKKMHPFSGGNDDFKITGLVSAPDVTRASRNYITLIVNNRPIKNYELVRAVVEAYHTFLPKDRFPLVVVNIDLDPLLVDVNVHPAKIEVRFSKEEALKSFIITEITKTLKTITAIPTVDLTKKAPLQPEPTYRQPSLMVSNTNKQSLAN
jgi:DNA mismatch repair protein MutL